MADMKRRLAELKVLKDALAAGDVSQDEYDALKESVLVGRSSERSTPESSQAAQMLHSVCGIFETALQKVVDGRGGTCIAHDRD